MRVQAANAAPRWGHDLALSAQQGIENHIWPYVRRAPILVAELPDATLYAWMKFYVSDGTSNMREVLSDGVTWRYPTGASV